MTETYPSATKEMIKFVAELNAENNENSQRREKVLKSLKKKRDEIAKALIGIGNSLKALTEQKDEIEEDLAKVEKELAHKDTNAQFQKKFGISMYGINFNPKLTQAEVDRTVGDED